MRLGGTVVHEHPPKPSMYMRRGVAVALFFLPLNGAFAQRLSYGVIAGKALTDDFNSFYLPNEGLPTIEKSGGKGVIVGPMLAWRLLPHLEFEADALFRELRFEDVFGGSHNPTVTWQFPLLAKYRLASYGIGRSSLRLFVEAGPSFRTTGNLNANPSHVGISAGGGLDFRVSHFNVAPTLRYTRWKEDAKPFGIQSRPDQLEFLLGFSHFSGSDVRPFGKRLSVGVVLGTNLIGDYNSSSFTSTDELSGNQSTFSLRSGPRSFLVGPAAKLRIADGFSFEAEAIYRPVRAHYTSIGVYLGRPYRQSIDVSSVTWEFPVLANYQLSFWALSKTLKPFLEAGPSFRTSSSVTHYGFASGAGISAHLGFLNISPTVRYTRWQADPFGQVKTNEINLLVGFTF